MSEVITAADINGTPSHEDIRTLVRKALTGGMELYGPHQPWVVESADGNAIVCQGEKHLRYPYTLAADGMSVELGSPVPTRLSWRDVDDSVTAHEPEAGTRAFLTDLSGQVFSEGADCTKIEICRDGKWKHAKFGDVEVTKSLRESLALNFSANVREVGDLPLDYDHQPGPAPGWIKGLVNEGSSLFAEVELTPSGREKLEAREYRFFSPEYHPNWVNPRTGVAHGPTLFGGALTNKPFFRGMAAIQCSEVPPAAAGPDSTTAGDPGKEIQTMSEPTQTPGTQTGAEPPAVTVQQFTEMQGRLQAVEIENAALRAREERVGVESTLGTLRFNEGRSVIAPASRTSLTDALMPLPKEQREKVLEAVKGFQFADLSERGFQPVETSASEITLTASEETNLKRTAEATGVKLEEVRANYIATKQENLKALGRG